VCFFTLNYNGDLNP